MSTSGRSNRVLRLNACALVAVTAICLFSSSLTGCGTGAGAGGDTSDPEVAATVNGVSIPVSEIDRVIDQQITDPQSGRKAVLQPVELATARLQARRRE